MMVLLMVRMCLGTIFTLVTVIVALVVVEDAEGIVTTPSVVIQPASESVAVQVEPAGASTDDGTVAIVPLAVALATTWYTSGIPPPTGTQLTLIENDVALGGTVLKSTVF